MGISYTEFMSPGWEERRNLILGHPEVFRKTTDRYEKLPDPASFRTIDDFPGKLIETKFGRVKSKLCGSAGLSGGKEYCLEEIQKPVPLHYLTESSESFYVLSGVAKVLVGGGPAFSGEQQTYSIKPYFIIERSANIAWSIKPLKGNSFDSPLIVRALLTPPFDPREVVQVEVTE